MNPIPERVLFPQTVPSTFAGIVRFTEVLVKQLVTVFQEIGYRVNRTVPKDGSEAMEGPVVLMTYTVATLPTAADYTGGMIYVSDQSTGAEPAFSDGTNWRIVSTRAIVS